MEAAQQHRLQSTERARIQVDEEVPQAKERQRQPVRAAGISPLCGDERAGSGHLRVLVIILCAASALHHLHAAKRKAGQRHVRRIQSLCDALRHLGTTVDLVVPRMHLPV